MLNSEFLLRAMNGVRDAELDAAAAFLGYAERSAPRRHLRKTVRVLLIAAVLLSLFAVTAYAAGLFTLHYRDAEPDEAFCFHWEDPAGHSGEAAWTDAKLVLEFENAPESCQTVEFRLGWTPFELPEELPGAVPYTGGDGWFRRLSAEGIPKEALPEEMRDMFQPFMVESYYAPQFADGGALLLLYSEPEEILEETWGELQVLRFHAVQTVGVGDRGPHHFNYVVLCHPAEGWVVTVMGQADMETVTRIAQNLEIRQTDRLVRAEDYDRKYTFFDVAVG